MADGSPRDSHTDVLASISILHAGSITFRDAAPDGFRGPVP